MTIVACIVVKLVCMSYSDVCCECSVARCCCFLSVGVCL